MAFCRLPVVLVVLSVVQCFATVQVPVYLWGELAENSFKSNPLSQVKFSEFRTVLKQELHKEPFTVIFVEETLSVEDFSLKNDEGDSSFPYLEANIGDALYLPAVESPLRVLNKLADPEKVSHVRLTEDGLSSKIEPESGNFVFINLKDAQDGESRWSLLRRHNDFMEKVLSELQGKHDSVVAAYTGHNPSWTVPEYHSRVRRAAVAKANEVQLSGLQISFASVLVNGKQWKMSAPGASDIGNSTQSNTLNFDADQSITLRFTSSQGYWLLKSIEAKNVNGSEELNADNDYYALLGFAYQCAWNVSFTHINATDTSTPKNVVFKDLKIQPYFITNSTGLVWGDHFDCSGFFTAPIWSGLMVSSILLAIIFYGIMMMMDIRTMDRFDDPKGKTITINASE